MKSNKKMIIIFIIAIVAIYVYGFFHSELFDWRKDKSNPIYLMKSDFIDQDYSDFDISNRPLEKNEMKLHTYVTNFKIELFEEDLSAKNDKTQSWYIMLEKPDCQYFEVSLNGYLIGKRGNRNGQANLWNNSYYIELNESLLSDNNILTITMFSDYMTGVAGDILILQEKDYFALELITTFSEDIVKSTSVIAIFSAVLLLVVIRAWRNELYNIKVYIYFLISFIAISVSLLDYRDIQHIIIDYLTFKKLIVMSYHFALTFSTLAIATLLNAKIKYNLGMVGILIMSYALVTVDNMIDFRIWYTNLHFFLLANIVHLITLLIIYRKRSTASASVMLIGGSLCGISIIKVILITTRIIEGSTLIDLPLLIMIYVIIVLFVFYLELRQMAKDHDLSAVNESNSYSVNSYMQGWFTIDKSLSVVGEFSTSCNHIFQKNMVGESFFNLIITSEEDEFITDTLELIFNEDYDFKDGMVALLPEEVTIRDRSYRLDYMVIERNNLLLYIMLSDITYNKILEKKLENQKNDFKFIISALKSKQEMGFFIEKTKQFIKHLGEEGFTDSNRAELHTLKGNLGQLGFYQFEKEIHDVEEKIESGNYDLDEIVLRMDVDFKMSLEMLYSHVGEKYFKYGYEELVVTREDIQNLEKLYLSKEVSEKGFLSHLRELKYVDLKTMFNRYVDYIERVSAEHEKSVLPLEITGEVIKVYPDKAEKLITVLVAIFRNAVSHGIENPEERMTVGKDSYGNLRCLMRIENDYAVIRIKDDGRGINKELVSLKAIENNIISEEDLYKMNDDDIINLVFESNMSSKEEVDIYAGRGLGLSAVFKTVSELYGTIKVDSQDSSGTEFIIRIPLSSLRE